MGDVILPVQRECVDLKLTYVRILLEIFHVHVDEERRKLVDFESKPCVMQVLIIYKNIWFQLESSLIIATIKMRLNYTCLDYKVLKCVSYIN